ncbi:MFS transporter, FHS family, L-fucose permease [Neorhodopirellula lusitana]|uniref:MFS transporter, FHS family, L-fucose permease n=1 Tax=Neorhodopirellula lusitana TaxID=445327 RepID=A0ABY1Q9D9_9BACT|nr:MFS transporter [Neorhodopirellula lusitana]SMP64068.1 MFS transporter, FHS family, L-fucose permease [Neorhodopirellula lusitana]
MATASTNDSSPEYPDGKIPIVPKEYLLAFILTTCCFALWGFANDFTNPLVKVYENVFIITTSQASWLQFAFYTGYFCMALPAVFFIRKFSYKAAIMVGFAFYAIGALLAVPAASTATFGLFLLGSYILTYGLAFLETACNPYILAMGPKETATQRLNLAQAFNPIGSLVGMSVATLVLAPQLMTGDFRTKLGEGNPEYTQHLVLDADAAADATKTLADGNVVKVYTELPDFKSEVGALDGAVPNAMKSYRVNDPEGFQAMQSADLHSVKKPYIIVAAVVTVFLLIFFFAKMPTFKQEEEDAPFMEIVSRIFKRANFREGVFAQAFYVGAQIMCWTFIVHYGMEQVGISLGQAQAWNIIAMIIFLCSRWVCTGLLRFISPGKMLFVFALGALAFTVGAITLKGDNFTIGLPTFLHSLIGTELVGNTGLLSLVMISACMSLMFPTIYGIALSGMAEEESKLGSAFLIMSIVGGALLTKLQGGMIDNYGIRTSFWLPAICFVMIALFGFRTFIQFEKQPALPSKS